MQAKDKIVLLYADLLHIERTKDEGGGFLDGVTVSYLYGDNMAPSMHANGSLGQRPAKAFLQPDRWNSIGSVPGLYEGTFEMTIDPKGKPMLKLMDVDFLGLIEIAPAKAGKAATKIDAGEKSGVSV